MKLPVQAPPVYRFDSTQGRIATRGVQPSGIWDIIKNKFSGGSSGGSGGGDKLLGGGGPNPQQECRICINRWVNQRPCLNSYDPSGCAYDQCKKMAYCTVGKKSDYIVTKK